MRFLYDFGIYILQIIYKIASLFNSKASAFTKGRIGIFKKIKTQVSSDDTPLVWIHVASLGEFEQARPVIERFKKEFSHYKILLTFFSPSGYEVRKNYDKADHIFYLPWDTKKNASKFLDLIKPTLAIFIKYEFWYHYTHQLKKRNIPILSVSAIFREEQVYFKSYGSFFRSILKNFSFFFVQNDESVRLLKSIGFDNYELTGDTRFDRVYEVVSQGEEIEVARKFKGHEKVMVIGSCWPEDLEVLIPFINESYHFIKFIIAPHEITGSFINEIEGAINATSFRYSQKDSVDTAAAQVMIIDNIGMLGKLYRYGEFAYVGGAFGKGLHNILEAACYGIPIFFGNKNYQKFQEAVDLINRGGAFEVSDYRDFKDKYEMITLPETFLLACEVTKQYVEENLGATDKIITYCKQLLKS